MQDPIKSLTSLSRTHARTHALSQKTYTDKYTHDLFSPQKSNLLSHKVRLRYCKHTRSGCQDSLHSN
jgi:hypothetical protein